MPGLGPPGRSLLPLSVGAVVTLLLAAASAQGANNVANNLGSLDNAAQVVMTMGQAAYSVAGLWLGGALWRRPRQVPAAALVWGASFVLAVGLIPVAWVPEEAADWPRYALGAAALAGLVSAGALFAARRRAS